MNKEDMLLKTYTVLAKDPKKNRDALESSLMQLIELNPKRGIKCWEECIKNNLDEIKTEFGTGEFDYENVGRVVVESFECHLCSERSFVSALDAFANNKFLLNVLYTESPIDEYFSAPNAISYLIRMNRLQEADNILSAIYKNKAFNAYSDLWERIIDNFKYGDKYNPCIYIAESKNQPKNIQDFCMGWIERIKDEEEQAGALTFAMQMF